MGNEIKKVEETKFPIISGENFVEMFAENLTDMEMTIFDLPKINLPAQKGKSFIIESTEEEIKEIEGVVLCTTKNRAKWPPDDAEEAGFPECSSPDGKYSFDGKECATCPFNQFKSDVKGGKGKACKEKINIFFLREDMALPEIVSLPVTSHKNWKKYSVKLLANKLGLTGTYTKITAETVTEGANSYAICNFVISDKRPTTEETAKLKKLAEQLKATF